MSATAPARRDTIASERGRRSLGVLTHVATGNLPPAQRLAEASARSSNVFLAITCGRPAVVRGRAGRHPQCGAASHRRETGPPTLRG